MTSIERRRHIRKEVSLAAVLEKAGKRTASVMRDLSLGGAFMVTGESFAYGDEVIVHVRFPTLEADLAIASTVRWVHPDGCGVQFGVMGARETHALLSLTK